MLQWDELRITSDGKLLIIDVEVQNLDYYKDVYIDYIKMNVFSKPDDFVAPVPDSNSIIVWESEEDTVKHIRKIVDIDTIGNNLFFIYAVSKGDPAEDTPCGAKEPVLLGIVFNKALLYQNSIKALNTMSPCSHSKSLIDYILYLNAFELSLEVGEYKEAIKYWNSLFKSDKIIKSNCKCHGY